MINFEPSYSSHSGGGSEPKDPNLDLVTQIYFNTRDLRDKIDDDYMSKPRHILGRDLDKSEFDSILKAKKEGTPFSPDDIKNLEQIYLKAILISGVQNLEDTAAQFYDLYRFLNNYENLLKSSNPEVRNRYIKKFETYKHTLESKKSDYLKLERNNLILGKEVSNILAAINFLHSSRKYIENITYKHLLNTDPLKYISETLKDLVKQDRARKNTNQDLIDMKNKFFNLKNSFLHNQKKMESIKKAYSKYFLKGDIKNQLLDDKTIISTMKESVLSDMLEINSCVETFSKIINGENTLSEITITDSKPIHLDSQDSARYPQSLEQGLLQGKADVGYAKSSREIKILTKPRGYDRKLGGGEARINFSYNSSPTSKIETSIRIDHTIRGVELDLDTECIVFIDNFNPLAGETYHHTLQHEEIFGDIMTEIYDDFLKEESTLKENSEQDTQINDGQRDTEEEAIQETPESDNEVIQETPESDNDVIQETPEIDEEKEKDKTYLRDIKLLLDFTISQNYTNSPSFMGVVSYLYNILKTNLVSGATVVHPTTNKTII